MTAEGGLLFTVRVFRNGGRVCALAGDDLQEGIAGFGETVWGALRQLAANLEWEVDWRPKLRQEDKV